MRRPEDLAVPARSSAPSKTTVAATTTTRCSGEHEPDGAAADGALATRSPHVGSFGDFKAKLKERRQPFGSGWSWLVHDGSALRSRLGNQDSPSRRQHAVLALTCGSTPTTEVQNAARLHRGVVERRGLVAHRRALRRRLLASAPQLYVWTPRMCEGGGRMRPRGSRMRILHAHAAGRSQRMRLAASACRTARSAGRSGLGHLAVRVPRRARSSGIARERVDLQAGVGQRVCTRTAARSSRRSCSRHRLSTSTLAVGHEVVCRRRPRENSAKDAGRQHSFLRAEQAGRSRRAPRARPCRAGS